LLGSEKAARNGGLFHWSKSASPMREAGSRFSASDVSATCRAGMSPVRCRFELTGFLTSPADIRRLFFVVPFRWKSVRRNLMMIGRPHRQKDAGPRA
jgi:hypothetical protein